MAAACVVKLILIPASASKVPSKVWDEINYLSIPKFQRLHDEVREWISNFTPHVIMDVIIYPYWE